MSCTPSTGLQHKAGILAGRHLRKRVVLSIQRNYTQIGVGAMGREVGTAATHSLCNQRTKVRKMKMLCQIPRLAALCLAIAASTTAFGADNSSAQPDPEEILKLAEAQQPQLLETLEKLVNIDSGTGDEQGLAQVEKILVDRLMALGAEVETQPAETFGGNSIIGTLKGSGEAKIMLMVHYDTVFTKGEAEKRPFRRDAPWG